MSQRSRRRPGFYASLLSDDRDRGFRCLKYRPKVSALLCLFTKSSGSRQKNSRTTSGILYSVEELLPGRKHLGNSQPFEWRSSRDLREQICGSCANRWMQRETRSFFWERLKSPLAFHKTITMRHDVLRSMFSDLPSDLRRTPYLISQEELIQAGLGPYLKKCLTVTGGGCFVNTPISLKLLLGKNPPSEMNKGSK